MTNKQVRSGVRLTVLAAAGVLGAGLLGPYGPAAAQGGTRQQAFTKAAHEFGVPESVLLAVAYNESRWEQHGGHPSTAGEYGPMALVDLPATVEVDAKGDGVTRRRPFDTSTQSLAAAAKLLGVAPQRLKVDDQTNIRGGAALLASYGQNVGHGKKPPADKPGAWYGAVAKYSGATTGEAARLFADDVYATIRTGAKVSTSDGQKVALASDRNVVPDTSTFAGLQLKVSVRPAPECPSGLDCDFVPAAYQQTDDKDKTAYGSYDKANRPLDLPIRYIVLHDTEQTYDDAISGMTNPKIGVAANYLVRSADGHVTQLVRNRDISWHANDWYINMHGIGIEQEGVAIDGAKWYSEKLYHSTARLVTYLANRYHVPLDRQHIIGHDNVSSTDTKHLANQHWDPGPYWDWNKFMALIGKALPAAGKADGSVVTINPKLADNRQSMRDCDPGKNNAASAGPASFVWLRTAPRTDAPLASDPVIHADGKPGDTCAQDWGDKASAGQQFVVAGRQGDWVAIWFGGQKVWFQSPAKHPTAARAGKVQVIRPRPGVKVQVYGGAYPDQAEFPANFPAEWLTPLPYTLTGEQAYVSGGDAINDYYYAKTIDANQPGEHTVLHGSQRYYEIQLGHRIAFVKASDVTVTPA